MHIRKFLSIFLIGLVFAIAGCSPDSTSGISEEDRLPDSDGDGTVDPHDNDMNGNGTDNEDDPDIDGDDIPNADDSTPNGPGGEAPTPGLACTSAKVKPPKQGFTGALNTVSWELLPEGCGLSTNPKVVVTASYGGVTTESDPASLGKLTSNITLPQDCSWEGDVLITYDFSEIGTALGDSASRYITRAKALVGPCEWPNDTIAARNIAKHPSASCSPANNGDVMCLSSDANTCSGSTCFQLWANNQDKPVVLNHFKKPTWSVEGAPGSRMTIYFKKDEICKNRWQQLPQNAQGKSALSYALLYNQGDTANWELVEHQCLVRTTLHDNLGRGLGWKNMPKPGNFVLNVKSGANSQITIKSFSAGEKRPPCC